VPSTRELYQTYREEHDLRFRTNPVTGIESPSVTSVINFDSDGFFCSEKDLVEYAAQGNIIDARVRHYINTGEWVEAIEIEDALPNIAILKNGSLGLSEGAGNFIGFLDKYPITKMATVSRLFHKDDLFNGELDFIGIPHFKGAEEVTTVCDIKRTPSKDSNGMQLAAYCRMLNLDQGIIVPINGKTKQGFSKPKIYRIEMLEYYYEMFLEKREAFRNHYGI